MRNYCRERLDHSVDARVVRVYRVSMWLGEQKGKKQLRHPHDAKGELFLSIRNGSSFRYQGTYEICSSSTSWNNLEGIFFALSALPHMIKICILGRGISYSSIHCSNISH